MKTLAPLWLGLLAFVACFCVTAVVGLWGVWFGVWLGVWWFG